MDKPAESSALLYELIRERWSPRAFADRSIEPQKVRSVLKAAGWAPSSFNGQPWSYIVATKEEARGFRPAGKLSRGGERVGREKQLCSCWPWRRRNFAHNGQPNRHAFHDVGLANENLVLQAAAMGLVVHQMAGFVADEPRAVPDSRGV